MKQALEWISVMMPLGPAGQTISAKLGQAFAPVSLEVIDESHQHAGHAGARPDGESHFRVRIVSPRVAPKVQGNVRVEVEATAPEGKQIERVELYLNDARVATLFAPPYVQTIRVASSDALMFLRAVAFMGGGEPGETEDVVILNAPDQLEQVEVHLVELPTTVIREDKPVQGLVQSDFQVFDAGVPVKLTRFEYVKDLPLSIGMVVDSSASMKPRLAEAQRAAGEFFGSVLRPGDQAFVVAFDQQPTLSQKWTSKLNKQKTSALEH